MKSFLFYSKISASIIFQSNSSFNLQNKIKKIFIKGEKHIMYIVPLNICFEGGKLINGNDFHCVKNWIYF